MSLPIWTHLFVGFLALLPTIGYFMEQRIKNEWRALFALTASLIWFQWGFHSQEIYWDTGGVTTAYTADSLFLTGLGIGFVMFVFFIARALDLLRTNTTESF